MNLLERINIQPDVRSGKPCIAGTRITVYDILEDFPTLEPDDLRAALVFVALRERRLAPMTA